MIASLLNVELSYEQDIVYARQRTRLIAELLGLDRNDQTRLSTAVSEIARNAYAWGKGGTIEFRLDEVDDRQVFAVVVSDHGPGINDSTKYGIGLTGAKRLVDYFNIDTNPGNGTSIYLGKVIHGQEPITASTLNIIFNSLSLSNANTPMDEIRTQNFELMEAMNELKSKQEALKELNLELEDTNRGVLALYAELDEKAVQLARSHQLQTRFLTNMSHELKTPLNSILGMTRMLLDGTDGTLSEEQHRQVVYIKRAAEDLSILFTDLLDLAKLSSGRADVKPTMVSVDTIFSGLRGMLRPMVTSHLLNLIFETQGDLPLLYTDETKVAQILRNLLFNAIKFTEHGEIITRAYMVDQYAIAFSVKDTGIGITEENLERIFEEYFQVEEAQTGRPTGTGLGLPISQRLATTLGGHIQVESRLGKGSTFTVVLPVNYRCRSNTELRVLTSSPNAAMLYHILIVMDTDDGDVSLYKSYLRGTGVEILRVSSYDDIFEVIGKLKPLAIVIGISDGCDEAMRSFLLDERIKHLNVLLAASKQPVLILDPLPNVEVTVRPIERKWLIDRLRVFKRAEPLEMILIIDDEEATRYITKGHLADTRFRIVEACDGATGLALARLEQPCLIFLDIMMPGIDGFEVLRQLRADNSISGIPVIVMTSLHLNESQLQELSNLEALVLNKSESTKEKILQLVTEAMILS